MKPVRERSRKPSGDARESLPFTAESSQKPIYVETSAWGIGVSTALRTAPPVKIWFKYQPQHGSDLLRKIKLHNDIISSHQRQAELMNRLLINHYQNRQASIFNIFRVPAAILVDENVPIACQGCNNYHGKSYGGNMLICAIHPNGVGEETTCADFKRRDKNQIK